MLVVDDLGAPGETTLVGVLLIVHVRVGAAEYHHVVVDSRLPPVVVGEVEDEGQRLVHLGVAASRVRIERVVEQSGSGDVRLVADHAHVAPLLAPTGIQTTSGLWHQRRLRARDRDLDLGDVGTLVVHAVVLVVPGREHRQKGARIQKKRLAPEAESDGRPGRPSPTQRQGGVGPLNASPLDLGWRTAANQIPTYVGCLRG
jgi:hypothetical protein